MGRTAKKIYCGRKYKKEFEDVAHLMLYGEVSESTKAEISLLTRLADCIGFEDTNLDLASEYERWHSVWQFAEVVNQIGIDNTTAENLVSDLAETYGPHAEMFGIVEDYGRINTKLLHYYASEASSALKSGRINTAKRLAQKGADLQYWLAVMRIDKPL